MSKLVLSGFALAAPLCEAREAAEPAGQPSTEPEPPIRLSASSSSSVRSEQLATWLQRPRKGDWNRELHGRLATSADAWQISGREARAISVACIRPRHTITPQNEINILNMETGSAFVNSIGTTCRLSYNCAHGDASSQGCQAQKTQKVEATSEGMFFKSKTQERQEDGLIGWPMFLLGRALWQVIRYTPALEPADVFAAGRGPYRLSEMRSLCFFAELVALIGDAKVRAQSSVERSSLPCASTHSATAGVVLYTLLLGQQPFGAETPAEETKYRTTCTEATPSYCDSRMPGFLLISISMADAEKVKRCAMS